MVSIAASRAQASSDHAETSVPAAHEPRRPQASSALPARRVEPAAAAATAVLNSAAARRPKVVRLLEPDDEGRMPLPEVELEWQPQRSRACVRSPTHTHTHIHVALAD